MERTKISPRWPRGKKERRRKAMYTEETAVQPRNSLVDFWSCEFERLPRSLESKKQVGSVFLSLHKERATQLADDLRLECEEQGIVFEEGGLYSIQSRESQFEGDASGYIFFQYDGRCLYLGTSLMTHVDLLPDY
jgi:hypothetical protein